MESPSSDQAPSGDSGSDDGAIAELSERQYACLLKAGEGMSSKEIGRLLGIAPSTVDNHIHVAITKLHARNRWHAAQLLRPKRREARPAGQGGSVLLPPLGGRPNNASAQQRLMQIAAIATTSLIALTAGVVLILGAIEVFGFN